MQLCGCDILVRFEAGIRRQRRGGGSERERLDGQVCLEKQRVDGDSLVRHRQVVASSILCVRML
jgi:hypothetical protein